MWISSWHALRGVGKSCCTQQLCTKEIRAVLLWLWLFPNLHQNRKYKFVKENNGFGFIQWTQEILCNVNWTQALADKDWNPAAPFWKGNCWFLKRNSLSQLLRKKSLRNYVCQQIVTVGKVTVGLWNCGCVQLSHYYEQICFCLVVGRPALVVNQHSRQHLGISNVEPTNTTSGLSICVQQYAPQHYGSARNNYCNCRPALCPSTSATDIDKLTSLWLGGVTKLASLQTWQ